MTLTAVAASALMCCVCLGLGGERGLRDSVLAEPNACVSTKALGPAHHARVVIGLNYSLVPEGPVHLTTQ